MNFRLAKATEAERQERDRLTHAAWGSRLTVDEYVARETRLRRHPFSRGLDCWLLRGPDGQVCASCESYPMRSFLEGQTGVSYGIASVFTEESLRGRRYATRLLEEMQGELDAHRPHALLLFSEVGAAIYARLGYTAVSRPGWFALDAEEAPLPSGIEPLDDSAAASVLATLSRPPDRFIVWPTAAQLDWHRERERIYAERLSRPAIVEAGARSRESAIFWAADWKSETLYITLLRADEEARDPLLATARAVAARAGLRRVVGWQGGPGDQMGGGQADDGDSLPMIRPVGALRSDEWRTVPRGVWV